MGNVLHRKCVMVTEDVCCNPDKENGNNAQNSESARRGTPPGFMNKVAVLEEVDSRSQVANGQALALEGIGNRGGQKPPEPPPGSRMTNDE